MGIEELPVTVSLCVGSSFYISKILDNPLTEFLEPFLPLQSYVQIV
jgi:hypothetical protein